MWIGLNHILDDYVDGVKTRSILGRLNSIMVTIVALATSLLMVNIGFIIVNYIVFPWLIEIIYSIN
jgi:succinate dehydrogenase hydrophobic anchor subunit